MFLVKSVPFVYGLDLIEQERNGGESYYLVDGLGSTKALTDENGQVTDTYLYDAYGNLIGSAGSTENDYRFAGEQFDGTLGQYYLRQRYYDPTTGRFTRRDTWEGNNLNPVSLHKYIYANSNPVSYIDPSGLFSLAEMQAAQNIRNTLAEAQLSSYTELIRNTDSDGLGGQISGFLDKFLSVKGAAELSFGAIPFIAANLPVLNPKQASKVLKLAVKQSKGINIKVKTRGEAAELLRETIQGKGYRNSTGFTGNQVRQNSELFPQGKLGTYHWDYADTEHGGVPHIQVHDFDGNITRIFFEEGAGLPISQRHW